MDHRKECISYRYSGVRAPSTRIIMEFDHLSSPNILALRDWNMAVTTNQMERGPIEHVILLKDIILRRMSYLPLSGPC